ncbi:ATP-dependent acyl-CoA ligase [Pseudonocardia eucalypti]|uniref:ATP-dependent acyl-CoA ligase n=1 Tax=Pseudonocardia eucalypti TaxID=648755 RepID=A0ABP9PDE9_9PSEU|nr:crotonobetaine/carnitine-CoA ligase [Pseudonocardia eucalypti]
MTSAQVEIGDLHPFGGSDVWQLLGTRAATHAGRPFIVWQPYDGQPSRTYTYDEVHREAAATAAGLAARGVSTGDRVLIHMDNCPEFLIAWFACAALGAVAVTTNTRSAVDELAFYADDCRAVGAITQAEYAELVGKAAPGLRFLVSVGGGAEPFDALRADPNDLPKRPIDPLAPCSVQYTSGTTSRPKGVLWTQANALWGARLNAYHETLRPDDCHLVYLPLFHTNALAYSMLASLWVGARLVLVPKWSTSRFAAVSVEHGCTWISLMGLSIRALAGMAPPPGHAYRLFGTGMCDLPFDAAYGVKTIGWWGMTETISHPIVGDAFVPNRSMSMGRPSLSYEVKVVREDGAPVEPDESGELLVRGVRGLSLFAEYLNRPEATAESFDAEGWFRTGDLVTPHADGHLTFENRIKDMLKVGAENVSAAEVERVILGVPGVVEVGVVGRPDDKLDEVAVAFITTTGDDPGLVARIEETCREHLADFKRPRAVYPMTQLPHSTLNKINKVELRKVAGADADRDGAQTRWLTEAMVDPSGEAG